MALTTPLDSRSRKIRRPQHTHYIRQRPWQLVPFMIAPVMPGDTMRNLVLQARAVSDPIRNRLLGWSLEHYYFYVPFSAFEVEAYKDMLLDPDKDMSSYEAGGNNPAWYSRTNNQTFLASAYGKIVDAWFRTEDEAWNEVVQGSYASVGFMTRRTALDSMVTATDYAADIQEDVALTVGVDDEITGSEIEALMRQYEIQKQIGVTDLDYEDWLKTYGVSVPDKEDDQKRLDPELIRFTRNWSYPSNTIDPSDGSAASAVVWSVTERADKDRFFKEPGFIIGLSVCRPKVFMANQDSALALWLDRQADWLPALFADDPTIGFKEFSSASGPFENQTDGYWIDVRDLFMYGDQFVNFDVETADDGVTVALPTAACQKRYPSTADADKLFVNQTTGVGMVYQDGITTLMIASKVRDMSATV